MELFRATKREMLDLCLTLEPGFADLENLSFFETIKAEDEFVYLLGTCHCSADSEGIKRFSASRLWFTYRRYFPAIGGTGPTTDRGWGCMLRCGQMLMAQALATVHLGRDWQWQPKSAEPRYRRLLAMFQDKRDSLFSIHQIAQMGVSEGKPMGEWLGPNTIAQVLKKLAVYDDWSNLAVHVALDNVLISSDVRIMAGCAPKESASSQSNKSGKNIKEANLVEATSEERKSSNERKEKKQRWKRPLLIIIPLRLGLTSINKCYAEAIREFFKLPQCAGILGGRPNHAVYFFGSAGSHLLYLDPHVCQSTVNGLDFPPRSTTQQNGDEEQSELYSRVSREREDPQQPRVDSGAASGAQQVDIAAAKPSSPSPYEGPPVGSYGAVSECSVISASPGKSQDQPTVDSLRVVESPSSSTAAVYSYSSSSAASALSYPAKDEGAGVGEEGLLFPSPPSTFATASSSLGSACDSGTSIDIAPGVNGGSMNNYYDNNRQLNVNHPCSSASSAKSNSNEDGDWVDSSAFRGEGRCAGKESSKELGGNLPDEANNEDISTSFLVEGGDSTPYSATLTSPPRFLLGEEQLNKRPKKSPSPPPSNAPASDGRRKEEEERTALGSGSESNVDGMPTGHAGSGGGDEFDDSTYHCSYLLHMEFSQLDPSLALAFVCLCEEDYDDLVQRLAGVTAASTPPLFEVLEQRPQGWPEFVPYSAGLDWSDDESSAQKLKEQYDDFGEYDSDDQFVILE